ncbi:hypothetical protein BHM03_00016502 [Ensete ventricosum]|nr:hypothetical protein BHM03_00016502 [Ensete ventricosum]
MLPALATHRGNRYPRFHLQKIAAAALASHDRCLLPRFQPRPHHGHPLLPPPHRRPCCYLPHLAPSSSPHQLSASPRQESPNPCHRRNLLLGRTLLCHRGTLVPTASSLAAVVAAFNRATAAAPPCCHSFTLLPLLPLLVVSISNKKEHYHYLIFNCCLIYLLS